jgi:hypothetical protein
VPVEGVEQLSQPFGPGVDDRSDELVACLEVVVDVPGRHAGRLGDLGEGGAVDAVSVQQVGGAVHQPLPLAPDRHAL